MREADVGFRYSWKGRSEGGLLNRVELGIDLVVSRDAILSVV